MSDINDKQKCRKLYSQVISGYTPALFLGSSVYVKHFSDNEFSSFEEEYEILFHEAVEKGLFAEGEKLEEIIKQGHWSEEEEQRLEDVKNSIKLNEKSFRETTGGRKGEEHRKDLRKFIYGLEDTYRALEKTKNELVGTTAEAYAQRKNNERIILHSIYKDKDLKDRFYTDKEFDEITQDELVKAISLYNINMEFFTEKWIKMIAVMPSFLNSFFLCNDDPVIFYGKPVIHLTIYQTDLFSKGKYYKTILSESTHDGPDQEIYDQGLQKVVNWYDTQYSINKSKAQEGALQARSRARTRTRGGRPT